MTSDLDADAVVASAPSTVSEPIDVEPTYRYPGSPPFRDSELDRMLFKGRAREVDEVLHSILSSDLFLLYAVSGMGKSSLLNAGVLHPLRERGYWPVSLRLNKTGEAPIASIRAEIVAAASRDGGIELLSDPSMPPLDAADNLWDYLSALEIWRDNTLLEPVLIFDQFEELFTLGWDDAVREEFIAQFGEVARGHRRSDRATNAGAAAPSVKLVVVIREDYLGELEAMSQHVPQILRNRFRLGPLDPDQAKQAICEPALVDHPLLDTGRFSYSDGAASEILEFLGARASGGLLTGRPGVDPSQLQLVCQYVERRILPDKQHGDDGASGVEITAADLGGREGLDEILRDFYRRTIELFDGDEREHVRNLCEVGLINQSGRRLSREVGEITADYSVAPRVLERLVTERLLRAETRVGSVYYELAHDTLVAPILDYHKGKEEEAVAAERLRIQLRNRRILRAGLIVVAIVALGLVIFKPWRHVPISLAVDGAPKAGEIAQPGRTTLYSFAPSGSGALEVVVMPSGDSADRFDPTVDVTDPSGATVSSNQLGAGEVERVVIGNMDDSYRVRVGGANASTGHYTIQVSELSPEAVSTGDGGAGRSVESAIAAAGDVEAFTVDVGDGEAVTLEVTPLTVAAAMTDEAVDQDPGKLPTQRNDSDGATDKDGDGDDPPDDQDGDGSGDLLDPVIQALDPDGVRHVVDDLSSGGEAITISGEGTHLVLVSGARRSTGPFAIQPVTSEIRALTVGQTIAGDVIGAQPLVFSITVADADDLLHVEAVPDIRAQTPIQLTFEVTEPNGSIRPTDPQPGGGAHAFLTGAEGMYQVVVRATSPEATGQFEIGLRKVEPVPLDGSIEQVAIDGPGEVRVYEHSPNGEAPFTVRVDPDADLDVVVEIEDPAGNVRVEDLGGNGEPEVVLLRGAGTYEIIVSRYGATRGAFDIELAPASPIPLAVDAAVAGELTEPGDVLVYAIEATAAEDLLALELLPSSDDAGQLAFDARFEVVQPDGAVRPAELQPSGTPYEFLTGKVGTYFVTVRSRNSIGSFELGLRRVDAVDLDGDLADIVIDGPGDVRAFEYTAQGGGLLTVRVDPDAGLDVIVEVRSPNGPGRQVDRGGNDDPELLILRGAGTHTIIVSRYGATRGSFDISMAPARSTPLEAGTPARVDARVGDPVFTFEAAAGPALVVEAVSDDSGDQVALDVLDPSGTRRTIDDPSRGAEALVVTDPLPGAYVVVVRGATGGFGIGWAQPPPIAVGSDDPARVDEIDAEPGSIAHYTVVGPGVFSVFPDTDLDLVVEVVPPGVSIPTASVDESGAGQPEQLPVDTEGPVSVFVRRFGGGSGAYEVSFRPVAAPPD